MNEKGPRLLRGDPGDLIDVDMATVRWLGRWTSNDIIDAAHRLGWIDHDIALLVATLEEMAGEA